MQTEVTARHSEPSENDKRVLVSVFRRKIARCRLSPSYHGRHPNQPTALRAVCPMTL
jgi:hypothetical protein